MDSNQICQCLHSRWELQAPSQRGEQLLGPTVPTQLPSYHCPDRCSSSAPGVKCFSLCQWCRELFLLATDLHPWLPPGYVPGSHSLIPPAAVQEAVSHRSALAKAAPSNSVHTPCCIYSVCHLQRQCLGPSRTPQIQLSPACCLLLPWDKAFRSNTAASETAAYKYSCLLKATSSS